MASNLTGYYLSRQWWTWATKNNDKVRPIHHAVYFYAIEIWNLCGGSRIDSFGIPSVNACTALHCDPKTYRKAFDDLEKWGFITVIEKSTNQFTATTVQLNGQEKFTEARTEAHAKAILEQQPEQYVGNYPANDLSIGLGDNRGNHHINKPITNNLETSFIGEQKKINTSPPEIHPIEKKIWGFFGVNPETHFSVCAQTGPFVFMLTNDGRLDTFEKEFTAYCTYKTQSGENYGTLPTFLGTPEKNFNDGRWCTTSWIKKLNDYDHAQRTPDKRNTNGAVEKPIFDSGGRRNFTRPTAQ